METMPLIWDLDFKNGLKLERAKKKPKFKNVCVYF